MGRRNLGEKQSKSRERKDRKDQQRKQQSSNEHGWVHPKQNLLLKSAVAVNRILGANLFPNFLLRHRPDIWKAEKKEERRPASEIGD
jgi:hypothetical protein